MGFFNKLKNKKSDKNQELKKEKENFSFPLAIPISQNDDYIIIHGVSNEIDATHRDGHKTSLMVANFYQGHGDDAIFIASEQYAAFEVEKGTEINLTIMKKFVENYLKQKDSPDRTECLYIGEINGDLNDKTVKKSQTIKDYVDRNISSRVREFNREMRESQERNLAPLKEKQKEQEKRNDEIVKSTIEFHKKQREERKNNPYIVGLGDYRADDGKVYSQYNGINVKTGEILRVRELNKVCKDQNGRYLYTGYINNTANEDDVEIFHAGVPVCFTIDKRVNDIVQGQNPYEVHKLLELLSVAGHYRDSKDCMNYIGLLDKNGNILSNETSQPLLNKIQEIKQEALYKRQQQSRTRTK